MVTWEVEVTRNFIESKDQEGDKVVFPKVIRRLFVVDTKAIGDSGRYRIVYSKGKYTLSVLPMRMQPYWLNPNGKPESWYIVGDVYKREGKPMNTAECLHWLRVRMGMEQAAIAHNALISNPPVKKAA